MFIVRANANNAGTINTPNLQINSYASRRIKKIGGIALVANDIVSGMNMILVYNESQDCYYLLNPNASYLNRDGTAKMLGAIDMDSHKITNLTNGTASGDAVNYLQLGGDAAREFLAATATTGSAVVNKTQFDSGLSIAAPVGGVLAFAGTSVPNGWLECNGGQVSRTTYSALFSVLGTLYGIGDGSTTFNLPELRGEFIRGYDNARGVDVSRSLGSWQDDSFESHTHSAATMSGALGNLGLGGGSDTTPTTSATTSSGGSETRPRNIAMMYIIKT